MPSITINVTTEQAQRIAAAYGELFTPPGEPPASATIAQIRGALVAELRRVVQNYEHRQAIAAVVVPPLDVT
jgi:hypothetical protein